MVKLKSLWCFPIVAALLWSISLRAFLVEPLTIESLARQADGIVTGVVLSKTTQRDPTDRIYTQVQIQVLDVWKGAIGSNPLTIVHGGGVLGERESIVSGQVDYQIGEEVVSFFVRNARGEAVTLGLMQGKFHVWKEAGSGTKYVNNPFHGLPEELGRKMKSVAPSRNSSSPVLLSLAELKRRIGEVLK